MAGPWERFQQQESGPWAKFANDTPVAKPALSAGDMAADVAKSAGIGVVQGGIGLATLPGNLEALARMGIDAGARTLGVTDPQLSRSNFLPTYQDAKGAIEQYTGDFYEPKSTLGQYARTVGEFAPLGVGAGLSVGARAARVLAPAVTSETAGQLTEGTAAEPWARMGGALVGARLPQPGGAMRQARDPQHAAAVQRLEKEGVTALTAAQRTQNTPMRWVEDATASVPAGGQRAATMADEAAGQFTRAALRRAGVNADRATDEVLKKAFNDAGQEFNKFYGARTVVPNAATKTHLQMALRDYEMMTPEAMRIPMIKSIVEEASTKPALSGSIYGGWRSNLRRAQRGYRDNPDASRAVGRIIDTLDRAMITSAPKAEQRALLGQLKDMNERYRNLLAIEKAAGAAGENASKGLISPAALKNAIKAQNLKNYTRGRSEVGKLARAGETVLKPLRSSGTGERSQALSYFDMPGAAIGGAATGDVSGLLFGLARPAARALTARAVMSRPGQAAVQNERVLNPLAAEQTNALFWAPVVAQSQSNGLRGGSGPRYDEEERNNRLMRMITP